MPTLPNKRESGGGADGARFSTRHSRIMILSLTFGSLAMIGAVWFYYTRQRQATEEAAGKELAAVAAAKTVQIANWRRERIGDGRILMSTLINRLDARVLTGHAAADRAELLDVMRRMSQEFLYVDATLVDLEGNVAIRLKEDSTEASQLNKRVRAEIARETARTNDVVLSDLRQDTRARNAMMSLGVPVQGVGALILDIDPRQFLYPYLDPGRGGWPVPSRTAETILARREGNEVVYLSRLREGPGNVEFVRGSLAGLAVPADSVLDSGWSSKGLDYRGVAVLATVRRIPDSPWFLVCKIDAAEVDAPVQRLAWEMTLITALIGLANAAAVGLILRGQRTRMHQEREDWFRAVANDTPAYLWMVSPGEESSFINRPLGKFLGIDHQRMPKLWIEYLHPDDAQRARAAFLECRDQRQDYIDEFRVRRFDGEYRWVVNKAVPRFAPNGEFIGYAGSVLDITGRRNAEEQLRTANAVLANELAERTRNEREIQALSARLIGAQEDERKRLARELHDNLNQQIAALSIAMSNLKRQMPQELAEAGVQSDRIHKKLVDLAESVRRISHELHPALLQFSGLAAALREYCEEFGTLTGIVVSQRIEGSFESLSDSAALCIYRIVQEALQNVAKHAKVTSAEVELVRAHGLVHLTVSDRGVGMDLERGGAAGGLGLISIKERTRLAGGRFEIRSQPNEGTTIAVGIPE